MTQKLQVYKCMICGNMVEVLHTGKGELVCCGQPMNLVQENSTDAAKEKHVPVVEKSEEGLKIKVGEINHPMDEKHFIEWIEMINGDLSYRHFLQPGAAPEAIFAIESKVMATIRAYCNLHGLWKNQ